MLGPWFLPSLHRPIGARQRYGIWTHHHHRVNGRWFALLQSDRELTICLIVPVVTRPHRQRSGGATTVDGV